MKEAYCSYETSKLLKEKGFSGEMNHFISHHNNDGTSDAVVTCTHQMACAWLRKKGYHIAVLYQSKFRTWERIIQASTGVEWSIGGFDSYNEAVENGIKYTLENLI